MAKAAAFFVAIIIISIIRAVLFFFVFNGALQNFAIYLANEIAFSIYELTNPSCFYDIILAKTAERLILRSIEQL